MNKRQENYLGGDETEGNWRLYFVSLVVFTLGIKMNKFQILHLETCLKVKIDVKAQKNWIFVPNEICNIIC